MSRVILSRHDNGEEKVVVGYDRPMMTYFVHEYDHEGDCAKAAAPGYRHGGIPGTYTLEREADAAGIEVEWSVDSLTMLQEHRAIDYPASNVEVDLSGAAA